MFLTISLYAPEESCWLRGLWRTRSGFLSLVQAGVICRTHLTCCSSLESATDWAGVLFGLFAIVKLLGGLVARVPVSFPWWERNE